METTRADLSWGLYLDSICCCWISKRMHRCVCLCVSIRSTSADTWTAFAWVNERNGPSVSDESSLFMMRRTKVSSLGFFPDECRSTQVLLLTQRQSLFPLYQMTHPKPSWLKGRQKLMQCTLTQTGENMRAPFNTLRPCWTKIFSKVHEQNVYTDHQ